MDVKTTPRAARDLKRILAYSLRQYGADAARRYSALLTKAMADIGAEPTRRGSRPVTPTALIRSYPIVNSARSSADEFRVRNPVHKVVYEVVPGGIVRILAIVGVDYPPEQVTQRRRAPEPGP